MSGDEARTRKWELRETEWNRLAELSQDAHIGDVCRSLAEQAATMARFWRK